MSAIPETKTVGDSIPDRSLEQRRKALRRANEIRAYRKQLKQDIKAGRKNIYALIENPPQKIETMKVVDLLLSVPKLGQVKANKMLKTCRMSPSKTISGMSYRQRNELLDFLRRR